MSRIIDDSSLKIATAVQGRSGAHGAIIIDGVQVGDTLQCPHCNGHFLSVKGSGHRRTYCFSCLAVTCGDHACDPCIPFAKRLELCEKIPGLTVDRVPEWLFYHPEIKVTVL